jgi:O-antigen/teichoic acid export membrane protein
MFVSYLLWLFLSRITTPEVIGISSTVISIAVIFSVIVDLGVSRGSTRFLGKNFSGGQISDAKVYIKASLIFVSSGIFVCALAIAIFSDWLYPGIPFDLVLISVFLVGATAVFNLLRSFLIASLQTQLLPIIMIISSVFKIVLTVVLILIGTGAVGVTIGYLSAYLSAAILLSFIIASFLMPIKQMATIRLYHACKTVIHASVVSWVPKVIAVIGTRLGTIIVFGIEGASQAGFYFIAFSIFYAISALADSLFSVSFPILSAMDDQRKRFVWRMIKVCLMVILPISSAAVAYSYEIMGLFGSDYTLGSIALKIMLLTMLPFVFNTAIGTLIYAYGNYRQVLATGLSSSISRIVCYFIFVPIYGITGAALSFAIGSVIGFAVSVMVAKKVQLLIFWKDLSLIFIIPTGISSVMEYFDITYIIGIPIVLVLPPIMFVVLRILSKSDVHDLITILPDRIGRPLISILDKL